MKQTVIIVLIAVTVVGFAGGCKTRQTVAINEGPSVGGRVDEAATDTRLNRVAFLEQSYNRKIAVESSGAYRTPTNTLEVYVAFRNRTDYNQQIQIRTQFFKADGSPCEGPHEWQVIFIPPNAAQTYRTYSRGTDAGFYYTEVQPLR